MLDCTPPGRARAFVGTARAAIAAALPVLALAAGAGPLRAQSELVTRCAELAPLLPDCAILAQTAAIAQPRFAMAAAGGNPVPGDASTLGMRQGSTPRVSLDLRGSVARVQVPQSSGAVFSVDADGAVALYDGLSPAPTLGGVAALDLLGSAGILVGPGDGFDGSPLSGAIGARLGLLRESFTVPGVSLSGMYRWIGRIHFADRTGVGDIVLPHTSDWSARATVGKRIFALGTSAGIGWDHYTGPATITLICPPEVGCVPPVSPPFSATLQQNRTSVFGSLTWTSLVLNAVAEAGWQSGGSPALVTPLTGYEDLVRKGGGFGSLSLRLTI